MTCDLRILIVQVSIDYGKLDCQEILPNIKPPVQVYSSPSFIRTFAFLTVVCK